MKKSNVILLYGGLTAIASSIFYQVLSLSSDPNSGLRYFSYLILFLGLFVGLLQYRKANGGYLKFGQGYGAAMLMTLIISVIAVVNFFIILKVQPDYIDKVMALAEQNMINKGMSQDQIDIGMKYAKMFTTPAALYFFCFIGSIFGGAILGLIAAGLTTKSKPMFEEANEIPSNDTPQA